MVDVKWILRVLGSATSILLMLSPALTLWNTVRTQWTQQLPGLIYVISLFRCLLWLLYGTPMVTKGGVLCLTINGAGVGFELIFLTLLLIHPSRENRVRMKVARLQAAVVLIFITVACITILLQQKSILEVVSICMVVTTAILASSLSDMRMVIQTKRVAFVLVFVPLLVVLNTAVWAFYGMLANDIFVIVPNFVGLFFGLAQLELHRRYGRKFASIGRKDRGFKYLKLTRLR